MNTGSVFQGNLPSITELFFEYCKEDSAHVTNTCGKTVGCERHGSARLGTPNGAADQRPIVVDEDAKSIFVQWLEEHNASVIQVARAYTLGNDECQDLAQEILLQAWRSLPKFEGKASPATWFYRVALHTAMNWHRNDQARRTYQQPLLEIQTLPARSADCSQLAEQREIVEQLYKAIRQLPKSDVALVLLYLDELSYREMASVLGISESNVGVRLSRAKKSLATLMNVASVEVQHDES